MKNMRLTVFGLVVTAVVGVFCGGCKGTLGTDSVNISGSVLSGGKVIGGSLTVSSNTVSLGGSFAQGGTTNIGAIEIKN